MNNLLSLAVKMNTECLDYFPVSGLWDDASSDYLYATEEGIFLLPANAWMELDSTNDAEIVAQHGTRIADSWSMPAVQPTSNFNAAGVAEYYGLYLERNFAEGGYTLGQYRGNRLFKVITLNQVQDKAYITALCIEWAQ